MTGNEILILCLLGGGLVALSAVVAFLRARLEHVRETADARGSALCEQGYGLTRANREIKYCREDILHRLEEVQTDAHSKYETAVEYVDKAIAEGTTVRAYVVDEYNDILSDPLTGRKMHRPVPLAAAITAILDDDNYVLTVIEINGQQKVTIAKRPDLNL